MEYNIDSRGAERILNNFIETDSSEYKKGTERELGTSVAPEAKAAFNRKPYGSYTTISFKTRPVVRAHA